MPRYAVMLALCLAGCSSSSSSPDPVPRSDAEKKFEWGDRRPVRQPEPAVKESPPTPLPETPVPPAK